MASSKSLLPAVVLLLVLVMASEMGTRMVAEARLCESQSHKFVGPCVRQPNCAGVCHTEGFVGGVCRGHVFDRKCYCTKNC